MNALEGEYIPSAGSARAMKRRQHVLVARWKPDDHSERSSTLSTVLMTAVLFSLLIIIYLVVQMTRLQQGRIREALTLIRNTPLVAATPVRIKNSASARVDWRESQDSEIRNQQITSLYKYNWPDDAIETAKPIDSVTISPVMSIKKSVPKSHPQLTTARVKSLINSTSGLSLEEAEPMFMNLYKTGSVNREFFMALGKLYSRNQLWKKANRSFAKACENGDGESVCLYNLAVSYDHLQNSEKAREFYIKALAAEAPGTTGFDAEKVIRRLNSL